MQENSSNVSVMEALRKGKSMLLLPRILFSFGLACFLCIGLRFFTVLGDVTPNDANFVTKFGLIWIATFIPFIILPYWFWSRRTTRWKLWAFEHVKNVHELKHVARRAALYANYGSFLDKITIQTKSERKQWANLQYKFNRTDIFEDDVEVPAETIIYFSIVSRLLLTLFYLAAGAVALLITIAALHPGSNKWIAVIGIGLMAWMVYLIFTKIKDIVSHKPQIILSNKGIETVKDGFQSWEVISNERLAAGNKKKMGWILVYNHPNGITRIDTGHHAINYEKLDHLLRVYRGRYNSKRSA